MHLQITRIDTRSGHAQTLCIAPTHTAHQYSMNDAGRLLLDAAPYLTPQQRAVFAAELAAYETLTIATLEAA